MTWVKVDDDMPWHRKFRKAGDLRALCLALDLTGICYCAKYATDGFLDAADLPGVLDVIPRNRRTAVLDLLVDIGRWEIDDQRAGYWIRNYLKYNPPASKVTEDRERRAENTRRWRTKKGGDRSPSDHNDSGDRSQDDHPSPVDNSSGGVRPARRDQTVTSLPVGNSSDSQVGQVAPLAAAPQVTGHGDPHRDRSLTDSVIGEYRGPSPRGLEKPQVQASLTPPPRDPSPDPAASPAPSPSGAVSAAKNRPPPKLSAQLRAEAAAKTLAAHGVDNGQVPPPPATKADVDPADFEAERRRQLDALKAAADAETDTP